MRLNLLHLLSDVLLDIVECIGSRWSHRKLITEIGAFRNHCKSPFLCSSGLSQATAGFMPSKAATEE
jgi:hypothetical protein